MLPSPSVDPETMKCLTQKKSKVNPSFISALNEFKRLIETVLAPKRGFTDGELVTGQGTAIPTFFVFVQSLSEVFD